MNRSSVVAIMIAVLSLIGWPICRAEWQEVKIPETWKTPRKGLGGYAWYRCVVAVPKEWRDRPIELFAEPVDDAREFYLNGESVGRAGAFPPKFQSGLASSDRHTVDNRHIRFGEGNLLAVRVYDSDGRGGFNVAAPVLFGGEEAIRLQGGWQFQAGDDLAWARPSDSIVPDSAIYATRISKVEAERILKQLPGEEGPHSPNESLQRLRTPDDLVVELVLSEPEIGQPLHMSFDERGRMWVMNYKQYPHPAGLTAVSRDKFLRTVFDKVPLPPPNHVRGADQITIHDDSDRDGRFDRHSTFLTGLNMASSFACGRGGVWVLNPPYLLFYPDRNRDDVPDGDPEVHLEGFGLEDSHAIANSLRFGPDGWLYAAQGSTVTGNIRRYGSQEKPIHSLGQLIWRYQPESRRYEVFAEGGGNTFGVEIDSKGRVYSGHNGGDTRGFHYVQGGYYQKGFGKHGELSNPYAFGYFLQMPHQRIARFTHAFVLYEGGALPAAYAGKLFSVAPLQSHVVISDVQTNGASFKTRDIGHALSSEDPWFRPVAIAAGPDGAIYVADFHEQRIDHASHYQGRVATSTGRVYRLRAKDAPSPASFDYGLLTSQELIERLKQDNRWHREAILQALGDRRDPSVHLQLQKRIEESTGQVSLDALWALHLSGGLMNVARVTRSAGTPEVPPTGLDRSGKPASATSSVVTTDRLLQHKDPFVRLWTVRLLCDEGEVSEPVAASLAQLARVESHVEARSQLACSARRLPARQCLPIIKSLLHRDEDAGDVFIPLLLWWAIESKSATDRDAIVDLFRDTGLWEKPLVKQHILARLMRRFAQAGTQPDLLACAALLEMAPGKEYVSLLMGGFETAYAGRELAGLPGELTAVMAKVGGGSLALRLRRSDSAAVEEALGIVANERAKSTDRVRYLQIFGQIRQTSSIPVLLQVAASPASDDVRAAALSSLSSYDDPRIPQELVDGLASWPIQVREVALSVLASRRTWAATLLGAVDRGTIARDMVSPAILRRILLQRDATLGDLVKKHWGEFRDASTEEMRAMVDDYAERITAGVGNPYQGKRLFAESCGKCHQLFHTGGEIGPDLTVYKRDDLRGMLMHVVNPSLEIREGFENFVITTGDGRTLNGFIADQDNRVMVLRQADGQSVLIRRDEIEEAMAVRRSIMPEGLLKEYTAQQLRDLFAYLRSTQPLAE